MSRGGFRLLNDVLHGEDEVQRLAKRNLLDPRASRLELGGNLEQVFTQARRGMLHGLAHESKARRGRLPIQVQDRQRLVRRRGISGVVARDRRQEQPAILNAAGKDADVVKAPRQREDAPLADPTIRGFEADDAVVGSRAQHRAGGLAAEGQWHQPRSHAGRRAAARSARGALVRPRVTRSRWVGLGELGRDHFAQQDGPGSLQARDGLGIGGWDTVRVRAKAGRGCQAGRIEDVLGPERDTVERGQLSAGHGELLGCPRSGQRAFAIETDPGLDARVDVRRPRQQLFDQLHRRQLARPNQPRRLGRGQLRGRRSPGRASAMGWQRVVAERFQRFLTDAPDRGGREVERGFQVGVGDALLAVRIYGRAAQLVEHGQSGGVVALLLHAAACYSQSG